MPESKISHPIRYFIIRAIKYQDKTLNPIMGNMTQKWMPDFVKY
ncbi:hypothetical protein BRYFOR_07152 [Marvinbryantia formatexigens DSM 14469]|uniref:Uncharacterized protein n=1 Tax=Marvinbryantia formatexigens DSM 14469 TaxID=478749 RepID=C6LEV0_9FIRM|nr:hypothetical protein BRYFOR_07152 [Marvinbryantia formatexigens DSM 14469]